MGYGFTDIPKVSGHYLLMIDTWRPQGTLRECINGNIFVLYFIMFCFSILPGIKSCLEII